MTNRQWYNFTAVNKMPITIITTTFHSSFTGWTWLRSGFSTAN